MIVPDRPIDFDEFDPYYRWLGIPKKLRPPTYYQLLGVSITESDRSIIESASRRQSSHVEQFRGTEHDAIAARLLYELELATVTLLSPQLRREYDLTLRSKKIPWEIWRRSKTQAPNSAPAYHPSTPVGEGDEIVRSFAGVMSVILLGFIIMAVLTFYLPWQKVVFNGGNNGPVQIEIANRAPNKNAREQPLPLPANGQPVPQAEDAPLPAQKAVNPEPEDILASVEVVIKNVDLDKRSISVTSGEKSAEFDVSKSARITVDGEESTLASLQAGQSANVDFNAEYDVALKIDARSKPQTPVNPPAAPVNETENSSVQVDDSVEVDATIVSVNLDQRSLTAKAGSKTIQLELSQKTEVILDGKISSLEDIAAGQAAAISFNPEYDIVTRIKIVDTAAPADSSTEPEPVSSDPKPEQPPDDPNLVSVEVELESIDVEKRTVTVIRKSKSITFDVSRKAKITINGTNVSLEELHPKQAATIAFDQQFEIISRIEAHSPSTESDQQK